MTMMLSPYALSAAGASSSIQYVGGTTGVASGTGSQAVSLTSLTGGVASAPSPGDLVIVTHAICSNTTSRSQSATGNNSGAYTNILQTYQDAAAGYDSNYLFAYKIMGATPDTSITLLGKLTSTFGSSWTIQVWRGVHQTTPLDVAAQTWTSNTIAQPNPPSITPVTAGAVVVACGGAGDPNCSLFTSLDLSNFLTVRDNQSYDAVTGMGSVLWGGGAVDPATWGGGNTSGVNTSAAVTIALRPA